MEPPLVLLVSGKSKNIFEYLLKNAKVTFANVDLQYIFVLLVLSFLVKITNVQHVQYEYQNIKKQKIYNWYDRYKFIHECKM